MDKSFYENLEFIEKTPGHGMAYYDAQKDQAVVVYSDKVKIFFDRDPEVPSDLKYPCAFLSKEVKPIFS